MTERNGGRPLPRRPAYYSPEAMEAYGGVVPDPAQVSELAHETAAIIVGAGRANDDPAVTRRLVTLVEELGLSTLAELWAALPARTLPGALWRLYTLREWVRRDGIGVSADYTAGMPHAEAQHAVAGAAEPPGPQEMQALADAILHGVYEGDLAVALERAGAFCRIVASGQAHRHDDRVTEGRGDGEALRRASHLQDTGADLEACARLWRKGELT